MRALLLSLVLGGCAGPSSSEPPPQSWDAAQKDAVRMDIVAVLIERERYDLALQSIGQLRQDGLDDIRMDMLQAEALTGKGLYTESVDLLEHLAPRGGAERLRLLGLAYFGQRDLDSSIKAFRRAIQQADRSERAGLYNNLGFALAASGAHEDALDAYADALRIDPAMARARNNMGFSLAALGRDGEAQASFQAAAEATGLQGKSARAEAWYNLGVARELRGDSSEAREAWLGALEMNPDHERAKVALNTLPAVEEKN